jgi:DNA-binding GntR family transcriptional regulator
MSKEKNSALRAHLDATVEKKLLLDRVNLPIRVCDLLRSRIIANELPYGAKLTEDSLAKELGVSRTPVREAFNRLAQEGLVTVFPGRGAFVATLSFSDMVQLLEIRETLEGMAARLATNRLTKTNLGKLRRKMEVELEKAVGNDYTGYLDVDRQFHESVISASGNQHLSQLMKSLRDRIQMLRHRSVILPGRAHKSFQEHLQIIDALATRDPDLAEERIRTHIRNVKTDLTIAMGDSPGEPEENHQSAHSKSGKKSYVA